jgi:putative Mn2+ efflux pump MntP
MSSLGFFEMLMIAVGMAMDAFAVSLGAGASGHARGGRAVFRLSFHFGLFQFLMPVLGWYLGSTIAPYIGAVDHWIAFGLLAFVGGRMIRSGFDAGQAMRGSDPSRGLTLVALCVATSLDALAIGLSLAMLRVTIWYPSAVIGVVTGGLSLIGLRLGTQLGSRFGTRMEIVGGVILVGIGLRIVVGHLIR